MLTYDESKPGTREGLTLVADGEFAFANSNHFRYESASLQRAKAKAVLEALDAQLGGSDAPPDDIKRMLLEWKMYWKWRDSVTSWTDLFSPDVAALLDNQPTT
jgi:hypothetical protein